MYDENECENENAVKGIKEKRIKFLIKLHLHIFRALLLPVLKVNGVMKLKLN